MYKANRIAYKYQMYTTLRNFAPFHPTSFFLDKHYDNCIKKILFNLLFYLNSVDFLHYIITYCNCILLTHALPIQRPFLLRRDDSCHPPLQDENYHSIFSYKTRLSILIIQMIAFNTSLHVELKNYLL